MSKNKNKNQVEETNKDQVKESPKQGDQDSTPPESGKENQPAETKGLFATMKEAVRDWRERKKAEKAQKKPVSKGLKIGLAIGGSLLGGAAICAGKAVYDGYRDARRAEEEEQQEGSEEETEKEEETET